jgi:hypothetical protein
MLGAALAVYGAIVGVAIWSGVWFRNGGMGVTGLKDR